MAPSSGGINSNSGTGMKAGTGKTSPPAACVFPVQYEDEESEFYYSRFRYYDAETGQYLCAGPIGLKGGINAYQSPLSEIAMVLHQ